MAMALEPDHEHDEEDRLIGMGWLLQHWLDEHCTLSTDVLLLVSLSEKREGGATHRRWRSTAQRYSLELL